MEQWYIEYCDLYDVSLKGQIFIGSNVKLFGEVVNEDSLYTAVGTGSWDVEGNFTNNHLVSSNLKFNFHQNFTNSGSFSCTDLSFVGTNDYIFSSFGNSRISFNSEINSLEGKLIIKGKTYLKSSFNHLVVKEIVLDGNTDLYFDDVRFGNSDADLINILYGNSIYMNGNNAWYEKRS